MGYTIRGKTNFLTNFSCSHLQIGGWLRPESPNTNTPWCYLTTIWISARLSKAVAQGNWMTNQFSFKKSILNLDSLPKQTLTFLLIYPAWKTTHRSTTQRKKKLGTHMSRIVIDRSSWEKRRLIFQCWTARFSLLYRERFTGIGWNFERRDEQHIQLRVVPHRSSCDAGTEFSES